MSIDLEQRLQKAVDDIKVSATILSELLKEFDLTGIPCCDRDLNTVGVGDKIKVAQFLLGILKVARESSGGDERNLTLEQFKQLER